MHALRLLTFSIINLTVSLEADASILLSSFLSVIFIIGIIGIGILVTYTVWKTPDNKLKTIKIDNPKT